MSPPLDQAIRPYRGQCLMVNLQEPNTAPTKNQNPEVEGCGSIEWGPSCQWILGLFLVLYCFCLFICFFQFENVSCSSLRIPKGQHRCSSPAHP